MQIKSGIAEKILISLQPLPPLPRSQSELFPQQGRGGEAGERLWGAGGEASTLFFLHLWSFISEGLFLFWMIEAPWGDDLSVGFYLDVNIQGKTYTKA